MSTQSCATIGIRVLGVAAIVVGIVFAGSSGVMRLLGSTSATNVSTADLHLHDAYYVVSHVEEIWFVPGVVSAGIGILLLVISRRLGTLLARGTGSESSV